MPQYKLIYFNFWGRAEVPRLLFAKAGVEYEDIRIEFEEFYKIKETLPFGQLPVLEIDGAQIAQSYAIARFLARRFGLLGNNELEEAEVDFVCLSLEDLIKPLYEVYKETDEIKKADRHKKYQDEELPKYLGYLDKALQKNNGGEGYFVGNSMTLADLYFVHYITIPNIQKAIIEWDNFPKLRDLKQRIESDHKIAEWIKKRPETSR